MDRVVWLVAGNKGNVGKSVMSKCLTEWIHAGEQPVTVVEGDRRNPDVAAVYENPSDGRANPKLSFPCKHFDLQIEDGWPDFSDYLCTPDEDGILVSGHVVTNLPDAITDRAMLYFERFVRLVQAYGYQVRVVFVMNTLPDGLHLFGKLINVFPEVVPVKNLHFGKPRDFKHFDAAYGLDYEDRILMLPAMNQRIMHIVRESNLSFEDFTKQTGNDPSNFVYAKIVVATWQADMLEALDDALIMD
jgi:hypothetical protein